MIVTIFFSTCSAGLLSFGQFRARLHLSQYILTNSLSWVPKWACNLTFILCMVAGAGKWKG